MAEIIRGKRDKIVRSFQKALESYEKEHPCAQTSLYRQNPASVRVRIIDNSLKRLSTWKRHDFVWEFLRTHVDEDAMEELSLLLVMTDSELRDSLANLDYEDPLPSAL